MAVPKMRGSLSSVALPVALVVVLCGVASSAHADEIRLKDGKKLYGVIVGYEDNMFKVKTDFGYVLVEKDKIAAIIPDSPGQPVAATAKSDPGAKPAGTDDPKPAPATEPAKKPTPIVTNASVRPEIPKANK